MQINNLRDFLAKIFSLYGVDITKKQEQFEDYFELVYVGINNGKQYNYFKALQDVLSTHRYSTLPSSATIIEQLNKNVITKEVTNNDKVWQGTVIAFSKSENGKELEYEFGFGAMAPSLDDTRKYLAKKGLIIRKIIREEVSA